VELFKHISFDWLGKKWWFFGISWALVVLGIVGYWLNHGLTYGIDFTGGTVIYLKFQQAPNLDVLRNSLKPESATPPLIQQYGPAVENTVQVRMQTAPAVNKEIDLGHRQLFDVLRKAYDPEHVNSSQTDFNSINTAVGNMGVESFGKYLLAADPDNLRNQSKTTQEIETYYKNLSQSLLDYRDKGSMGLIKSMDSLKAAGASNAVIAALQKDFYVGPFSVKGVETVGGIVGQDLRRRAGLAVGVSFLFMLVYIAFRFKPIYGVAAIVALFHDLAITLGLFALTRKEISMTVIAALLTLVGYSMNDTIVVFDRVRENLRTMRKESLFQVLNISISQTFARTIMTSLTTFVSVLSLFVFGGEVLNGFSFALTIGIIIGTYSSIGIASPIVEWWYRSIEQKSKRRVA
jgi:preprotein translocase subunit SecF